MVVHVGALGDEPPKNPWPHVQPTPPLGLPQANPTNSVGVLDLEPSYPTLNSPSPPNQGEVWGGLCAGEVCWALGLGPTPRGMPRGLAWSPPQVPYSQQQVPDLGPCCGTRCPPPMF